MDTKTLSYKTMPFKLDPIKRCTLFMGLFAGGALVANFSSVTVLHLLATLAWGLILYAFYTWTTNKRKNIWDTVITSLIIFLLLHYGAGLTDLIYPLLATFIAITQKFFIEYKNSPVINPAVFGLLLTALLLAFIPGLEKPFVSWWGASYEGYLSLAFIGLWIVGAFYQWKKWPTLLSFLLVYFISILLRGQGWDSFEFALIDSTVYFFASIMLIEPKTSPFRPGEQVVYGILAAVLLSMLSHWHLPYPHLFALAAVNLAFFAYRFRPRKLEAKQQTT